MTDKRSNLNWDDDKPRRPTGREHIRISAFPHIPYDCEPVEVGVDDVGEVTFESMCAPPRGKYEKPHGVKEPKTKNFVFSPENNNHTSNSDNNGNINSKKFEEKVRTERKQNMEYQKFLEKEVLRINAKGNQPRTFIKYMESSKPKPKNKEPRQVTDNGTTALTYSLTKTYVKEDLNEDLAKFSVLHEDNNGTEEKIPKKKKKINNKQILIQILIYLVMHYKTILHIIHGVVPI